MAKRGKGNERPIVIKRSEEAGHGHHGGAWKIAYADFVTAMMAFFLLMWLVNATTEAQRRGIADYFTQPNIVARGATGSGQPFGGRTLASEGRMVSDATPMPAAVAAPVGPDSDEEEEEGGVPRTSAAQRTRPGDQRQPAETEPPSQEAAAQQRRETLARLAEEVRQAIRNDPALASLGRQVLVEEVPEGLRVQLVDAEGQPVFHTGQAAPNERGRALLGRVASVLARQPHPVEITGHTDAAPFRGGDRSNWDLSADRANATRRLLVDGGVAEGRIRAVAGRAEREPLLPDRPLDAANRRVAVLMTIPNAGTVR
ncbi:MAG: OmpA family protein [Acetobacteraceae bacterium]|nr:OmpA family protein [Acetobacteraceae bacterium]